MRVNHRGNIVTTQLVTMMVQKGHVFVKQRQQNYKRVNLCYICTCALNYIYKNLSTVLYLWFQH